MKNKSVTVAYIKRQAKKVKKDKNITHTQALEQLAKEHGFANWKDCLQKLNINAKDL